MCFERQVITHLSPTLKIVWELVRKESLDHTKHPVICGIINCFLNKPFLCIFSLLLVRKTADALFRVDHVDPG